MGAIKSFYDNQKQSDYDNQKQSDSVEFVKPSVLPYFGTINIKKICIESWCDKPVFYFTKKGETKVYKSIVNYQLKKIFQEFAYSSPIDIDSLDIDDDGCFIAKESKNGKKYNYFVLADL